MALGEVMAILKVIAIVGKLAPKIVDAVSDGRLTIAELLELGKVVCDEFGISIDETGWDLVRTSATTQEVRRESERQSE